MRVLAVILAFVAAVPSSLTAQKQECADAKNPKVLPAASALLDSARALRELAATELPSEGLLFSLIYSREDSFPRTHVLDSPTEAAGLVLSRSLLPQKPTNMWAVRVRITGGASPTLGIERSTYCPPTLVPAVGGPTRRIVVARAGDRIPAVRRFRIITELMVSETGAVVEVRTLQPSGISEIDNDLVQEWRARRFLPALIDGVAIPSWYRTDGKTLTL